MEHRVEVPEYDSAQGMKFAWDYGFILDVRVTGAAVNLRANQAGLTSLANHLLNLAQPGVPAGHHFHLDELNSLEEGSTELIVEKIE